MGSSTSPKVESQPASVNGRAAAVRSKMLWIDPVNGEVWLDAACLNPPLSPAQWNLLHLLYALDGQIVTRRQIIQVVWPDKDPASVSGQAINALIKRLRHRLRLHGGEVAAELIEVRRGHGVCLINSDRRAGRR